MKKQVIVLLMVREVIDRSSTVSFMKVASNSSQFFSACCPKTFKFTLENREVRGVDYFEIILSSIVDFLDTFHDKLQKIDFFGALTGVCKRPFLPNKAQLDAFLFIHSCLIFLLIFQAHLHSLQVQINFAILRTIKIFKNERVIQREID